MPGSSRRSRPRAADLAVIASESDARLAAHPVLPERSGGFAQIIDCGRPGARLDRGSREPLAAESGPADADAPRHGQHRGRRQRGAARLPRAAAGGVGVRGAGTGQSEANANVLVVGESLADRNHALASLQTLLFVGGPIALLIACLAGYLVAASALEPVESMRSRAARMFRFESNERLPVSPARDEIHALGQDAQRDARPRRGRGRPRPGVRRRRQPRATHAADDPAARARRRRARADARPRSSKPRSTRRARRCVG